MPVTTEDTLVLENFVFHVLLDDIIQGIFCAM